MSSPSPDSPQRAAFLAAANQLGESPSIPDELLAKPWPDWLENVLFRCARVFLPELPFEDFRKHPERFFGNVAGIELQMIQLGETLNLSPLPKSPETDSLRSELDEFARVERERIKAAQAAAMNLPTKEAIAFQAALGTTAGKVTGSDIVQRIQTSPTVKICLFLLMNRKAIESREDRSVGALFERLRKSIFWQEGTAGNGEPALSMKAQFQKICSECGVRLNDRGRKPGNLEPQGGAK